MADSVLTIFLQLFQLLNLPLPLPTDAPDAMSLVAAVTATLANQSCLADLGQNPNPLVSAPPEIYDFIVVGGGTAGAVVSNRLSANPQFKVLLLEAGGDPTVLNTIPGLAPFLMHQPATDWMYTTQPTKGFGYGMKDNIARWTRYKGLGGCSSHNWMVYNRGHPKDFDNWANLTGDESWNYENVLPHFKNFENYAGKFPDANFHGSGGPFHVSADTGFLPSLEPWNAAAAELGYDVAVDFNTRQKESFGRPDVKIGPDGHRMDTYTGFIKPILTRPNFKVIRYANVEKVLLDESNQATGVVYTRNGESLEVRASKEIILSAGALNTPKLLMLSGIGPKEHLESVGVKPLVDLPGVGARLEDHPISFVGPFLLNDTVSYMTTRNLKMEDADEYATKGTGYFATNAINAVGFISSSINSDPLWPDIQLHQVDLGIDSLTPFLTNTAMGLKEGLLESWLEPFMGQDANWGWIDLARPKSTGCLQLASNRPEDQPLIDPNYYEHPDDTLTMVDGMKFVIKMYENTTAWGKYGAQLAPSKFPGCEEFELKSDPYLACLSRQATVTIFHPSGTCKMGKVDDGMAVVDSSLRVMKVKGLRIADASIMPAITNANINTPTLMIGEKAADMILKSYAS